MSPTKQSPIYSLLRERGYNMERLTKKMKERYDYGSRATWSRKMNDIGLLTIEELKDISDLTGISFTQILERVALWRGNFEE